MINHSDWWLSWTKATKQVLTVRKSSKCKSLKQIEWDEPPKMRRYWSAYTAAEWSNLGAGDVFLYKKIK